MSEPKISAARRALGWGKQIAVFLVMAIIITGAMDIWRGKDIPRDNLPDLQGVLLSGQQVDVFEMSNDKAVMVYFWGSWCPVCTIVSPAVDTLSEHFNVVTVAMSSGDDDKMVKYLKYKGYDFNVLNDANNDIARVWSVNLTPTLMIFKDGQLKFYTTGFTSLPGMWWRMLLA